MSRFVNIIKSYFPNTYFFIYNKGKSDKENQIKKEREERDMATFEYQNQIGNFIIAIPNEYQDMIIGKIIRHDVIGKNESPVAWLYDYIRGEEIMLWQKAYPFSVSFAKNIANLTPFDRHILFYQSEKRFFEIDNSVLIGWDKVEKRLQENGFFNDLKEI